MASPPRAAHRMSPVSSCGPARSTARTLLSPEALSALPFTLLWHCSLSRVSALWRRGVWAHSGASLFRRRGKAIAKAHRCFAPRGRPRVRLSCPRCEWKGKGVILHTSSGSLGVDEPVSALSDRSCSCWSVIRLSATVCRMFSSLGSVSSARVVGIFSPCKRATAASREHSRAHGAASSPAPPPLVLARGVAVRLVCRQRSRDHRAGTGPEGRG